MKTYFSLTLAMLVFITSCSSSDNSPEFVEKVTGRYLYNSDEVIEIYFVEGELFMKWRGAQQIKPLKVDDNSFYVKEMNEKIQFLSDDDSTYYMTILKKEKDSIDAEKYMQMRPGQFVPRELLYKGEFDKAVAGYLALLVKDSLDPAIEEDFINSWGYRLLRNDSIDRAVEIFKINVELYPNSSNVFDSLGEGLLKQGDTLGSISNYKKALEMDSANTRAERMINRLEKKDD
jgi:tetratricopeptide (TPR) repeat protein